jgi:pimeloyl-ACP methyl ester carboxylesterase
MESPIQALRSGDIPGAVAALAAMPVMRLVAVRDRQPFVTRMFNHNAGLFRVDPTRLVPARPPATEQLERLTVPVLFLVGDSDLTEASKVADLLAARAKDVHVARLERCSHLAPVDCPDQMLREVELYLRPRD